MLIMCRHCVKCYIFIISFDSHNILEVGIIKPILLMRRLRFREADLFKVIQLLCGRQYNQ